MSNIISSLISSPSDAVAAKMDEINIEEKKREIENIRMKMEFEEKKRKHNEEQMIEFEAKIRVQASNLKPKSINECAELFRLCDKELRADYPSWLDMIPLTKYITIGASSCDGKCFQETDHSKRMPKLHDLAWKNGSLRFIRCEPCKAKINIIEKVFNPIIKIIQKVLDEEKRVKEKAIAAEKVALLEARISEYDAKITKIISRHKEGCVHILPRDRTSPFVTILNAMYGKDSRSNTGYLSARKTVYRLGIEIPPTTEIFVGDAPVEWNNAFIEGKLPFLTKCPVCGKQNSVCGAGNLGDGGGFGRSAVYQNGSVSCNEHYSWEPETNKHYKYVRNPPPAPHQVVVGYSYQPYSRVEWDPTDPDGTIALAAAKEKRRQELLKELSEL